MGCLRDYSTKANALSFSVHHILDARRVQHNTDAARGGGRRQVAPELSTDNSIRPVCPQNFTPDAAELRRVGSGGVLRLVDKGNTFSQIEIRGRLILNALNFDQGSVLVLVAKTAFVSHDNSADVETDRLPPFVSLPLASPG